MKITIEQAVSDLKNQESFQVFKKMIEDYKETHVNDLSVMGNAENPQILAYLAGGIGVLNMILTTIDDCQGSDNS